MINMKVAYISHSDCILHEMGPHHPESPQRLVCIDEMLKCSESLRKSLNFYQAPKASMEDIIRAHDKHYVEKVHSLAPTKGYIPLDPDTQMNPYTLNAALRAAGAVIHGVDLILQKKENIAFCAVRPPGHHAEFNKALGFCFFNNIAVGVKYALCHSLIQRVCIIDFDVHHGNGTENIFKNNPDVLFCSSFQHPFYPFSKEHQSQTFRPIHLKSGTKGPAFRKEIEEKWFKAINAFQPQIYFISAGFDAHKDEVLADLNLEEDDFHWITLKIKEFAKEHAQGRIISCLEGGYPLNTLASCVKSHLQALTA